MAGLSPQAEAGRLDLYRQGLSDREIAKREGRHNETIREWRESRGLPVNHARREHSGVPDQQILDLYRKGLGANLIARQLGCCAKRVRRVRNAQGITPHARGASPIQLATRRSGFHHFPRQISLDGPGQHADVSLLEQYADPSMSSWLEEMGATVW